MSYTLRSLLRGSLLAVLLFAAPLAARGQPGHAMKIAALKYQGGGDWYQGQTPLPNFLAFVREQTRLDVAPTADVVELTTDEVFEYPFLVMSGHGNVVFSDDEAGRLRRYLEGGGFLFIDDDYGMDAYVRREMKKVFADRDFVELPFDHPVYRAHFAFENGPPKIHEHDNATPRGFAILHEGRVVVYYLVESNITDGWESPEVHGDSAERREQAFRMGTNLIVYATTH